MRVGLLGTPGVRPWPQAAVTSTISTATSSSAASRARTRRQLDTARVDAIEGEQETENITERHTEAGEGLVAAGVDGARRRRAGDPRKKTRPGQRSRVPGVLRLDGEA